VPQSVPGSLTPLSPPAANRFVLTILRNKPFIFSELEEMIEDQVDENKEFNPKRG
jgi:hypothetical protein